MSRCLSLLALSVVLVSTSAWANPIDAYGLSARIMGLGGAGTALSEGFESNYYNPAAVAATDSLVLELGYAFHQPSLTLNEADLEVDSSRGLHGGSCAQHLVQIMGEFL